MNVWQYPAYIHYSDTGIMMQRHHLKQCPVCYTKVDCRLMYKQHLPELLSFLHILFCCKNAHYNKCIVDWQDYSAIAFSRAVFTTI